MLSDWRGFLRLLDPIGHQSCGSSISLIPRPGQAVLGLQLSSRALSPHTHPVLLTLPQQGIWACLFP